MDYLSEIDLNDPKVTEHLDELSLWSAPFGMMMLNRVPMRRGVTILDVGCGTGFLTLELAQRCGPDSTIVAVDPWAPVMDRLRSKIAYLGLENVWLIQDDAANIDLPDSSADFVVSNLGINNFDNADAVLQACFRVAKPGGRLFLTTNVVGHMGEFYREFLNVIIECGLSECLAAFDAHVSHRQTVQSISGMLTSAGFEIADVVTDSFRMRYADGSSFLRHYFMRLGFMPAWKVILPEDAVESAFISLESRLNQVASEQGELSITIPMACIEAAKPFSG